MATQKRPSVPRKSLPDQKPWEDEVFAKFIQCAMPMPRSMVMTWTGSMLISNTVRQTAAFAGPTKIHWPARSGKLAGWLKRGQEPGQVTILVVVQSGDSPILQRSSLSHSALFFP